jgi:hypothetical protein
LRRQPRAEQTLAGHPIGGRFFMILCAGPLIAPYIKPMCGTAHNKNSVSLYARALCAANHSWWALELIDAGSLSHFHVQVGMRYFDRWK